MAKIINKKNHLKTDLRKLQLKLVSNRLLMALAILLGLAIHLNFIKYWGLLFIPVAELGLYFYGKKLIKDREVLKAGLVGEQNAIKMVKKLPDSYSVITDLEIESRGRRSQMDLVVVGDNGVFIIEVKNTSGKVRGHANDEKLKQEKFGRNGQDFSKEMYNPVKQVSTHGRRLKELFDSKNIKSGVQPMVYFIHEKADVSIKSDDIPVFCTKYDGEKKLFDYIVNAKKEALDKKEQKKIIEMLKKSTM